MKKTFVSVLAFVAIASFGGIALLPFSAQAALTPAQAASVQATLNTVEAELAQLEAQENVSPTVVSGATLTLVPATAVTGVSTGNLAAAESALSSLVTALSGLETTIANTPQLTPTEAQGVSAALQGVSNTLATISTIVSGGSVASASPAPAGSATPTTPVASVPTAPLAMSAPSTPTTPAITPAAPTDNVLPAPTAQAASSWSFKDLNWPFIVVGILVVAAIALWLWWPSDEEDGGSKGKRKDASGTPVKPAQAPQMPKATIVTSTSTTKSVVMTSAPQTPLSAAISTQAQKTDVQQQRKPA